MPPFSAYFTQLGFERPPHPPTTSAPGLRVQNSHTRLLTTLALTSPTSPWLHPLPEPPPAASLQPVDPLPSPGHPGMLPIRPLCQRSSHPPWLLGLWPVRLQGRPCPLGSVWWPPTLEPVAYPRCSVVSPSEGTGQLSKQTSSPWRPAPGRRARRATAFLPGLFLHQEAWDTCLGTKKQPHCGLAPGFL